MNFFDAQDRAKRTTRWLVIVYLVSTALIVAGVTLVVGFGLNAIAADGSVGNGAILTFTAVATTLFIFGASLFKTSQLSAGGGRVALEMGGTLVSPDVQDPLRRRLRNVVEEMAIASGVPVPEIYVLEAESGINAFAAGYGQGDAAIAVTRGALTLLDREELQGVIAHEFSHILNGDMRLNIRMMGVLFGIMVLGLIGRIILRGGYHSGALSGRRRSNSGGIVMIGIGLMVLGWVGVLFARFIKSAVSRQREYLADASAVQFTRQTSGIANALKKIGGYTDRSYITHVDPEEISHMLFAGGIKRLSSLFATHPPLTQRIKALEPGFDERDYPRVDPAQVSAATAAEGISGFATAAPVSPDTATVTDNIAEAVGQPSAQHVAYAQTLRTEIPDVLYDAAHSTDDSFLLAIALIIEDAQAERQLPLIAQQLGNERSLKVRSFHERLRRLGRQYRLPLLEVAFPALRRRPRSQIEYLLDLVRRLIEIDGDVNLGEFCFYRTLESHLGQSVDPAGDVGKRVGKRKARMAAIDLIRIVADQGNDTEAARDHAFEAGIAAFGRWASDYQPRFDTARTVELLGPRLDILRRMNASGRKSLLQAISNTIAHDGRLDLREAELLRAICASLDCPLPPIITATHG